MKRKLFLLIGALLVFSVSANAATVLIVDLSVTDQVTITATDAAASASVAGSDSVGVYLANIFTSTFDSFTDDFLVSGDLTSAENTSDGSPNLFVSGLNSFGMNIFSFTDDPTSTFLTGMQAFSGSATWNISTDLYDALLMGNSSGDVYAFADVDADIPSASIVGQWEIAQVPVPAAVWLLGSALLGLRVFGSREK